ncbi:MAG: Mur ligase family protein [Gemmatimonadaceae bacterium]|nr:Mur ligase family protein [Gemmatimonadaceae bacterium]
MTEPSLYSSPHIVEARRLTGPHREGSDEAATVQVALDTRAYPRASDAIAAWDRHARRLMSMVGVRGHITGSGGHTVSLSADGQQGTSVRYASITATAPVDALMAMTELLESAWVLAEREVLDGVTPDVDVAVAHVCAVAATEAAPAFAAAHAEAVARRVITTFDDESLSIGAGQHSRTWLRHEVPPVAEIPWDTLRNIPVALITGSNGKTTVTRWLARMLREAGHVAGMSTTDGLFVDDVLLDAGDYSGPQGARTILRDPRVTAAALETARGGILRRGLAVHHADAACVTNLSMDHFVEYGIVSEHHLARAKLTVAHAVRASGTLVVSADDPVLRSMAPLAAPRIGWVTLDGNDAFVTAHTREGGDAALLLDDVLLLHHARRWHELVEVRDVPLAADGAARHNVANALFAATLAAHLGVSIDAIQRGLRAFGISPGDTAGRFVRMAVGGATVVVDFAHNPAAVEALIAATAAMPAARRAIAIGTGGNREDEAIRLMARTVTTSGQFDRIVAKDVPRYRRGRAEGEMPAMMIDELRQAGVPADRLEIAMDDRAAADMLLRWLRPGDLVLLTVHSDREAILARLTSLAASGWQAGTALPE